MKIEASTFKILTCNLVTLPVELTSMRVLQCEPKNHLPTRKSASGTNGATSTQGFVTYGLGDNISLPCTLPIGDWYPSEARGLACTGIIVLRREISGVIVMVQR